jgi:hypothetical protein
MSKALRLPTRLQKLLAGNFISQPKDYQLLDAGLVSQQLWLYLRQVLAEDVGSCANTTPSDRPLQHTHCNLKQYTCSYDSQKHGAIYEYIYIDKGKASILLPLGISVAIPP